MGELPELMWRAALVEHVDQHPNGRGGNAQSGRIGDDVDDGGALGPSRRCCERRLMAAGLAGSMQVTAVTHPYGCAERHVTTASRLRNNSATHGNDHQWMIARTDDPVIASST